MSFQVIFYANYLQLTVLSWKTQEPCLTRLRWCNSALYGVRSIHILWMILSQRCPRQAR